MLVLLLSCLITQLLKEGTYLGKAAKANLIQTSVDKTDYSCCERTNGLSFGFFQQSQQNVFSGGSKSQISSSYNPQLSFPEEMDKLLTTLKEYHDTLSITEGERGETTLVEFNIDASDLHPIKQAA